MVPSSLLTNRPGAKQVKQAVQIIILHLGTVLHSRSQGCGSYTSPFALFHVLELRPHVSGTTTSQRYLVYTSFLFLAAVVFAKRPDPLSPSALLLVKDNEINQRSYPLSCEMLPTHFS